MNFDNIEKFISIRQEGEGNIQNNIISLQPTQLEGNPFTPPQPREGGLFGREEELAKLHELLQSGKNVCVVAGMGGVGKTELVREYADRPECKSFFTGGIYYIDVKNRENLAAEIIALTKWRFKSELPANLTLHQIVTLCWQQWKGQTENILLILDDVSNLAENLKPYLPPKDLVTMRLLMTSRETPDKQVAEKLELEVLSESAAVQLLASIIGQARIDAEPEEAKLLCYELGYLPLALELVAYYLEDEDYQHLTLSAMRQKLKAKVKHPALSPEAVPMAMQAKRGLQAAFDLSWDELKPEAKHLACVLGAFAPFLIYWDMVTAIYYFLGDELFDSDDLKDRWLKSLRKLHFIITLEENIYTLHPLVSYYFSEQLRKHSNYTQIKQAFCDFFASLASNIDLSSCMTIFNFTEPHLKKIIAWNEGNEDNQFALSINGLAILYHSKGRYSEAEPLYKRSLEINKHYLGAEHPHVASSLNNLALLYTHQKRYSEAEAFLLQSIEIFTHQLGADHPEVATCLNNLAGLYRDQGCYSKAEPLYLKSLEIRKCELGDNHPDVAISMNNLALLYESLNRYSEAETLHLQALKILKCQLGTEDPKVATSLHNLALFYYSQRCYSKAEVLHLQALDIRTNQLGKDHPDVAQSLNDLALLYYSQGCYSKAESLYEKSLKLKKQLFGEDHLDVAQSLYNLALLYESQGRYHESEFLYLQSLEIRKSKLGYEHPDVAYTLQRLAVLYAAQNKFLEAKNLSKQALEICNKTLCNNHLEMQSVKLTAKAVHIQSFLQCNTKIFLNVLQAFAQPVELSELNTEMMLVMLERLESNPELLSRIREALHQNTKTSDDNT